MQLEDRITRQCFEYSRIRMNNLKPSHGWDHVERVVHLAERIGREEKADPFIVSLAALLHDIGRDTEDRSNGKSCHAEAGSKIAYTFLTGEGLDKKRSRHIADCILTHRFRNNHAPKTLEAQVVYDADKLDSIGAVGIGRAFLFAGEVGAKLHNHEIDIFTTEAYTVEDTAYREYAIKLRHIKSKIITRTGKRIAEERHNFMEKFFIRLQSEVSGNS